MSGELLPVRPVPPDETGDLMELVLPGLRADLLARWELRAAQWRAVALAEAVFGGPVGTRLLGQASAGFRGLLELGVPFVSLEAHREAEARFLAEAARDELLGRTPLVVVFTPRVAVP